MARASMRPLSSTLLRSQRITFRETAKNIHIRQRAQTAQRSVKVSASIDPVVGLDPELKKSIDTLISSNTIVVFMKGTRQFPQCGFSNTVVQILNTMGAKYETVDILADTSLRSGMKVYSQWPTFPQVYINGDFFGGCDVMTQAYQSGELQEVLEVARSS